MRITDVRVTNYTQPIPPILRTRVKGTQEISLITITTDEGLTGYSMGRSHGGYSGAVLAEMIVKTFKRFVVGKDPLDREAIWQAMWRQAQVSYSPIFPISAIDVALWDLGGKIANLPVYKMLGASREKVPTYSSSAFLSEYEEYRDDLAMVLESGMKAYKIHPMLDFEKDMDLCRKLRDQAGPDVDLMLDVGCAYNTVQSMKAGRICEELNFLWFEEPISPYDLEGYKALCRNLDIPIAGAETLAGGPYSTAQYIRSEALDLVMCDVYWRGGITGMMKIAHLSESCGLNLVSHHGGSPVMNSANLHVLCAIPNCDSLEVLVPEKEYNYGLTEYPAMKDGCLSPPNEPGLGVHIDFDYIKAHTTSEF